MSICYPDDTNWGCYGDAQQIASLDEEVKARAEALAWMHLAALTADQLGVCPITVRPCRKACRDGAPVYITAPASADGVYAGLPGRSSFFPHIGTGGFWINACGCGARDCSCTTLCEAILPGPVGAISEVWLNGAVLDPTAYRVDNGNRLVRTDGDCWPSCQDMTQDAHGEDAFSVTYYQGAAPDEISKWMAGLLAVEYYKACTSDKSCRLPARTQQVSRQGVSYTVDFGDEDSTGIREVDDYVRRLNPYHLKMAPIIVSPQSRRTRQPTVGRW